MTRQTYWHETATDITIDDIIVRETYEYDHEYDHAYEGYRSTMLSISDGCYVRKTSYDCDSENMMF